MSLQIEEIKLEIEKALTSQEEQGNELVPSLRPILIANLERGRVERFIEDDLNRVGEYVQKVFKTYRRLNPLINQLIVERTDESWEALFGKMQKWAYNLFVGKNFSPDMNTQEIAGECATEAAIEILRSHFPYDTEFEPWACVIVQHACQKYIRKGMTSEIPLKDQIALDQILDVADPVIKEREHQKNIRNDLLDILAKLPAQRRQIIEFIYFDELSLAEIAQKMNKSIGAIYSLHFHALLDLRAIMSEPTDNS